MLVLENGDSDYIFGLPGNPVLDQQVAEIADNLRFHHAKSDQEKLRTHTSFRYQASSWTHPRKVVARLAQLGRLGRSTGKFREAQPQKRESNQRRPPAKRL